VNNWLTSSDYQFQSDASAKVGERCADVEDLDADGRDAARDVGGVLVIVDIAVIIDIELILLILVY
jgi:hypothetical protein